MFVFCVYVSVSSLLRMVSHAIFVCLRASCVQLLASTELTGLGAITLDLLVESVDYTDVNSL